MSKGRVHVFVTSRQGKSEHFSGEKNPHERRTEPQRFLLCVVIISLRYYCRYTLCGTWSRFLQTQTHWRSTTDTVLHLICVCVFFVFSHLLTLECEWICWTEAKKQASLLGEIMRVTFNSNYSATHVAVVLFHFCQSLPAFKKKKAVAWCGSLSTLQQDITSAETDDTQRRILQSSDLQTTSTSPSQTCPQCPKAAHVKVACMDIKPAQRHHSLCLYLSHRPNWLYLDWRWIHWLEGFCLKLKV